MKTNVNLKKFFACVLSVVFLLSMIALPASAGGLISDLEMDISIMNELTARVAVNNYFSQRLNFLKGETDDITTVNRHMFSDEQEHKSVIDSQGMRILSSQIAIESISCWSTMAIANVNEMVVFLTNGFTSTATITHEVTMSLGEENNIVIQSDLYNDPISGFSSASYISPEEYAIAEQNAVGSKVCIANVAYNERGTTRGSDGDVIYRKWFENTYGMTGNEKDAWCVMFVVWCARHADVSASVIPTEIGVPNMLDHFDDGRYFLKSGYTPQPGDLIFINHKTPNASVPTHIGIVQSVSGSVVWLVDGNWQDAVHHRSLSINDTSIVGYARPSYGANNHTYTLFGFNANKHWEVCENCGYANMTNAENHTRVGWNPCSVCDYDG